MLKIKAALISLVLGSSSIALASPGVTFSANADASFSFGPTVRDHRIATSYTMPARPQTAWIALSAPMSLRSGSAVIRPELARISQLRLQASRGMTYVRRLDLRFRDGTYQSLQVNQWLTLASSIDLKVRDNRRIDSITVIGMSGRGASHQLFANGSRVEMPQPPVYQPPVYQPPVYQPPVYQPPVYQGFKLGEDMSFAGTDGRRIFQVGAEKGAFNTLRLQGATGSTFIKLVKIDFMDGSEQALMALNKTLLAGQIHDIALDGFDARTVNRVWVYTNDGTAVAYSTGTFSASLL
jgi:hypothetical protein